MTRESATGGTSAPAAWCRTARLAFRELRVSDLDDLHRLDRDPDVMRYIRDGRIAPRAETEQRLARSVAMYPIYPGLGRWYASRRDTGAFIGWFVLNYVPETVQVEIGYRLAPEAWGHGFATEGATELVRYGLRDLGLDQVIGVTHPDNIASQRVLLKSGLRDAGWGDFYHRRLRLFVASASSA